MSLTFIDVAAYTQLLFDQKTIKITIIKGTVWRMEGYPVVRKHVANKHHI